MEIPSKVWKKMSERSISHAVAHEDMARGLCLRSVQLLTLLLATALMASGFCAMHYKVFLELLESKQFQEELKTWSWEPQVVREALKSNGKEPAPPKKGLKR